ncbi:CTPC1 [Auxenochlorella protothecoides x Auxenochlorella symbiontica]
MAPHGRPVTGPPRHGLPTSQPRLSAWSVDIGKKALQGLRRSPERTYAGPDSLSQDAGRGVAPWWAGPLRGVAALFITSTLSLGGVRVCHAANWSSLLEDRLVESAQGLEAAVGGVTSRFRASLVTKNAREAQAAQTFLDEVWEVVGTNFEDVRSRGFRREDWQAQRAAHAGIADLEEAHSVVRAALAQLHDPYSRLISRSAFAGMLKYDVSGVGLNLVTGEEYLERTNAARLEDGRRPSAGVWVLGVIQGSLAEQAGVRLGDELLEVAGHSVCASPPFKVASLLQGGSADGADLALKARRLDGSVYDVSLPGKRAGPSSSPVSLELPRAPSGDAVVKLRRFDARAAADVAGALARAEAGGAGRVILDLRSNRGGLVTEGVEVASLFLAEGDVVLRSQGRGAGARPPYIARSPPATSLPLVLLVDGQTASAAEAAAGALRGNCRAVVAGRQTFGKGLIQSVYELSDGSGLVLTVGKYFTPAGVDIDREGIEPDFRSVPDQQQAEEVLRACRLERAPAASA